MARSQETERAPGTVGPLSADELARYARHIVLPEIGGAGQQRFKSARVLLVGAGAAALVGLVGGWCRADDLPRGGRCSRTTRR